MDSCGKDVWYSHELGTLEAGKLADIVVLKQNLFDIPAEDIPNAGVELTISDGNVVFEAPCVTVDQ
ncbi:amidohydrolase family protein [Siminovitchia acidinfaciens]|uniref:amidohydrolase family protein n=1 Tax=Siminovitchia acidinfaciens TaxID=2321395 RepID=UPI0022A680E9|nr:amidohydrolase family protein [Siminovitchia acidinfaciens]